MWSNGWYLNHFPHLAQYSLRTWKKNQQLGLIGRQLEITLLTYIANSTTNLSII